MARRKKRTRGSGSLKLRGRIWWIIYTDAGGRPISESSGSDNRDVAEVLLQQRIGAVASGEVTAAPKKVTLNDLCSLVIKDYEVRKLRDAKIVKWRYESNTKPLIGNLPAVRFGTSQVRAYVEARRRDGMSNATINRELSTVRRGFRLGMEEDPPLVHRVPYILKLEEDNARQGFLEDDQYENLVRALPDRLKALFAVAYHVGTRKGELRKLEWRQVDFGARMIHLEPAQTKGKSERFLPFFGEMEEWLRWQQSRAKPGCPYVFFHGSRPVGAQLHGWREACEKAGVPALLFHDLRRTGVRNMRKGGVEQSVRMKISGHKTTSMERRYNILDQADIRQAADQMDNYFKARKLPKKSGLERVK